MSGEDLDKPAQGTKTMQVDVEVIQREAVPVLEGMELMQRTLSCQVKHSIRGRLRITIPLLKFKKDRINCLQRHLSSTNWIEKVDGSYRCGSLTIHYEFPNIKKSEILEKVEGLTLNELDQMTADLPAAHKEEHELSLAYLKGAAGAVGLSLFLSGVPGLALAIVYPALIFICLPIYKRAYRCLRHERRLNVDFLDACALTVGMLTGDVINASLMVMLIHLGDYIRDLTAASSQRTIRKLLDFQNNHAWVLRDGVEVQIQVKDIVEGDVVALNTGDLIPVDGEVIEGELIVDQQVLTGESLPAHKEVGDKTFASTVIKDGNAYIKATRVGDRTKVAQVVRMVEEAPLYETKIQNHAEKFADRLVAPSLITTTVIFAGTMNLAQLAAMLTVDFGTGVRVAAPTAVLSSMITSASNGILIKGGSYLEKLCHTDTIIFDKTGTLTTGVIHVEDMVSFNGYGNPELLSYAATAEMQMTHPIAEAVVRHATNRNIPLKNRTGVKYVVGRGVQADIEGKQTLVGSLRLMRESGVEIGSSVLEKKDNLVAAGKACLYVAIDEKFCGLISFRDQVRKESKQVIEELHRVGVKQVIMLTGDVEQVAKPVCDALGIDKCYAEMLPEQKADVVKGLKEKGHTVAFVGDGINDSVALSYADIGISVKGGADIAKETAGVILLNENLLNIPKAFEISKETIGLIKESYWIVGSFNVFAYALAAFGLASPVLTTLISNGSAVVACLNGMKPMIRMKLGAGKKKQTDAVLTQQIGKLRLSSGKKDDSPQGVERIPYQQNEGTDSAEILVH
ncbi:MAG: heavy metal translocating P-type ATPase [Deltaproteobacteria bacterium]|nr:heavy metal translocating P-type ATPase [Deltaproteobacteria bacterium]